MNKLIYCVDFDGTLCQSQFPDIGQPKWNVINFCKEQQRKGNILILFTCREGHHLKEALTFCESVGLHFEYVNENVPERIALFQNDCRKIGADYYIDDKAIHPDSL